MDGQKTKNRKQKKASFQQVLKKSSFSFLAMTPMLIGVIGLVGLLQVLVSPRMLSSLFRGNAIVDTLIGTLAGAVASGNPVVSYLLGGELLEQGISLYAVSAFILSWVTLGFVHLPVETEVLGFRFTLYRNILAFVVTMIIAALTPITIQALT
ncbi:MAG: permease [Desulfovibrionaceae bacterium]|nr:permease [Desulfovibrionaceae bacterium]